MNHLDKQAKPLEYMISLFETNSIPTQFDVFNAKDELKCIRGGLDYLRHENELLRKKLNDIERKHTSPLSKELDDEYYKYHQ